MLLKEVWKPRPLIPLEKPKNKIEGAFYFSSIEDHAYMLNILTKYQYLAESIPSLPSLIMRRLNWGPINSIPRDKTLLLNPNVKQLKLIEQAISIINDAIKNKFKIIVWGDYDVDGMTATTSLFKALYSVYSEVMYRIPNRRQGYGLHMPSLRGIVDDHTLVITVDTGIAEIEEIKEIKKLGGKVIVTDHHLPQETLPEADVIIDPKTWATEEDDEYMVSGCFVAAQLGHYFLRFNNYDKCNEYDDFVSCLISLSILSDMIDLNKAMRLQLDYGMICLNNTKHDGLLALINNCGIRVPQDITSTFLSFGFIPKLNAAGRMDDVGAGMDVLLLDHDDTFGKTKAKLAANKLKSLNTDRKIIENQMFDSIVAKIGETTPSAIVVYDENFSAGLVGICAARLVEKYHVPTIVLTGKIITKDDVLHGSGRSPANVSLFDTLNECSDLLEQFGGHNVAAGLSLKPENLDKFKDKFTKVVEANSKPEHTVFIDAEVTIENLYDLRFQMFLRNIEPAGNKNEPIMLILRNVTVTALKPHGEVTDVIVKDSKGFTFIMSKFRAIDYDRFLYKQVDVLLSGSPNYFANTHSMDWRIYDIKLTTETLLK